MSSPLQWLHYVIHRALLNTMDTHSRPCFLFQGRAYVRRNGQDLSTLLGYLESPFLNFWAPLSVTIVLREINATESEFRENYSFKLRRVN